jgi:hypothetical protein
MSNLKSIGDIRKDDITQVLSTIEYEHHEIHGGSSFTAHHKFPLVGSGAFAKMYFKSPASGPKAHMIASFSAKAEAEFQIRESATVSLSGTALTAFNRDRNSSNSSTCTVRSSATVTMSGTSLGTIQVGGGNGAQGFGGGGSGRAEFILKVGTIYLFQVKSEAASNDVIIEADWYEHTDL